MGIKDLWTILAPFCDRKPLYELQNKKVAIDLSGWVCEAQNITEFTIQPKMYLRNLYFRTCYLLLMEVYPVFVLEGEAPVLKHKTIAARNAIQFKGSRPKKATNQIGKDRTKFNHTLKQCQEMLDCLGIICIRGMGEAEALCAYLNEDGLVDGIISQDSDCFAYGARIVYRNFSISQQGGHAASGGAVDVYDITKVNQNLNFGRNKIIALALLCGSDYSDGVHGVGKDSAMKLLEGFDDAEILPRFKSWRENITIFEQFEKKLMDKTICISCGHKGNVQSHKKKGCLECQTNVSCGANFKKVRLDMKNEVNIRKKAIEDPDFPNQELIDEFLIRKDKISGLNIKWKKPDLVKFVNFTTKYLTWLDVYAFEKFLPILTRWQLKNYENPDHDVFPKCIKKIRNPKGTPSYEIIWYDKFDRFKTLIPASRLEESGDLEKLWSTVEPQNLVESAYPTLVDDFRQSKIKPAKRKNAKNPTKSTDTISKPEKKKHCPMKLTTKTKTIDAYFKQVKKTKFTSTPIKNKIIKMADIKCQTNDNGVSTEIKMADSKCQTNDNGGSSEIKMADINCQIGDNGELKRFDSDLEIGKMSDSSNFCEGNDSNLSDLVEDVIKRDWPDCFAEKLNELGFKRVEKSSEASFFLSNSIVENDLFEKSLHFDIKNDSEEIIEYNLDCDTKNNSSDNLDEDSFVGKYVPLLDRIKNK